MEEIGAQKGMERDARKFAGLMPDGLSATCRGPTPGQPQGRIMKNDIFDQISPEEALKILRQITKTDKNLKKKIIELAEDLFREVDVDEICEAVFDALDGIDVHELWDRAGRKRDGYASPQDMAVEMFEEALAPFVQEMQRLLDLKMQKEAKLYCMGILKGIFEYEEDSGSEFKDWASDVPGESFGYILREWAKNGNSKDKKEMKNFIKKEFPARHSGLLTQFTQPMGN